MKFSSLLICIITCWNFSVSAQSYKDHMKRADSLYDAGDYLKSGEIYDSALINVNTFDFYAGGALYDAACSWSLAGDIDKSLDYLELALKYGWANLDHMNNDSDLNTVRKERRYRSIRSAFIADSVITQGRIVKDLMDRDFVQYKNKTFDPYKFGWVDNVSDLLQQVDVDTTKYKIDSLIDFSSKSLSIISCSAIVYNFDLNFLRLKNIIIENMDATSVTLLNIEVSSLTISRITTDVRYLSIYNVNVNDHWEILSDGQNFSMSDCVFGSPDKQDKTFVNPSSEIRGYEMGYDSPYDQRLMIGHYNPANSIEISRCKFYPPKDKLTKIWSSINCQEFIFEDNSVHNYMQLEGHFNSSTISGNKFHKPVDISNVIFPEFNNYIPFDQFETGLGIVNSETKYPDNLEETFFKMGSYDQISDVKSYDNLINSYQFLYNNYRQRGELQSANAAFVKIKDISLVREKYLYDQQRSFAHWIKYKLGILMKFYTDHGTNPAKAILISMYIIGIFAMFYFFFPSEWDKNSKTKLMSDFRKFIQKNDHGYFKPFVAMTAGFMLSLVNALTLSLNSFVTLGFGTIPTTGLGRYVCIIQGFIGWFLLSIFTVAMINQVLA